MARRPRRGSTGVRILVCIIGMAAPPLGCRGGDEAEVRAVAVAGSEIVDEQPLAPETEALLVAGPKLGATVPIGPAGGSTLAFVIDAIEPAGQGATYVGHVDKEAGSSGTLAVIGGTIAGAIRVAGRPVYQLATSPQGGAVIRAIDTTQFPPDHAPEIDAGGGQGSGEPPGPIGQLGDTCTTDDPRRITA